MATARTKKETENLKKELIEETEKVETPKEEPKKEEVNEEPKKAEPKKYELPKLASTDDIEVISLIGRVGYQDSYTGNIYTWEEAGDVNMLSFREVENMWNKHKNYFRSLILKPLDERVVKQYKLEDTYKKYDILLDSENFNKDNVDTIIKTLNSERNNGVLRTMFLNRLKSSLAKGEVNDHQFISSMAKELGVDLSDVNNEVE